MTPDPRPSPPSAPGALLGAASTPFFLVAWWCLTGGDDRPVWYPLVGIVAGVLGIVITVMAALAILGAAPPAPPAKRSEPPEDRPGGSR